MAEYETVRGIFDSHAHYDDDAFAEDQSEVIASVRSNGVSAVTNIGCDLDSSRNALRLAETYDWFYASAGIHPGNADQWSEDVREQLKQLLSHPKAVAVGEFGLDYHYRKDNREEQIRVFRDQMDLARELDLPVILHIRDATSDMFEVLKNYPADGVVHCFSGSAETAKELVKMGYHIGFTGVVTFENAQKTKKAALEVPVERILLETDAPYMAPVPFRGKRCTSDLIRFTAAEIARIKGIGVQSLIDAARENAMRLYRIKQIP